MTTEIQPTRIEEYIRELLPWTHGHQAKSIATFVAAIIEKQTGNQAELARTQGNQEAAVKRLSRLIHNQRLKPEDFSEWLCRKTLEQLPRTGKIRITIDWTIEDDRVSSVKRCSLEFRECASQPKAHTRKHPAAVEFWKHPVAVTF